MENKENSLLAGFTLFADACLGTALYAGIILANGMFNYPGAKASIAVVGLAYLYIVLNGGIILYRKDTHSWQIPLLVLRNTSKLILFASLLLIVSHIMILPALEMATYFTLVCVTSSIFRLCINNVVKEYRKKDKNRKKVVLVGSAASNIELYEELVGIPTLGYTVTGYFDDHPNTKFPANCKYLGSPKDVTDYLRHNKDIRNLYCSLPSQRQEDILPIIHYCVNNLVEFYNVPSIRNYLYNRMNLNMVGSVPVLGLYRNPLSDTRYRMAKRLFDIAFSLTFLCTLFPFILLIVSIITKCTMPGPVFFKQKRSGLNNKPFYCLKFRSMVVNNDADKVQATKNDPRKTKWGDIMRKTNIDELPQFINVLKGEMSVVGPRPHMLKHTDEYSKLIDKYMVRHIVKPGITGWSQVTGFRGETKELWQMEERVKRDLWYIQHWTFGLDLLIILKTITNAIKGEKQAY